LIVAGFEPMEFGEVDPNWRPLFFSKDFVQENPVMDLEQYRVDVSLL